MGYYIFSYAVDTDKVKKAFNSKDETLFNQIKQSDIFENYSNQEFGNYISTEEALQDIIWGRPYKDNNSHTYGYAFIDICANLGKKLPYTQEIKLGYETDLINKYLKSEFGISLEIERVLLENTPDFGLPPIEDWPLSGIVEKTELEKLKSLLSKIEISDEVIQELWDGEDEEDEDKACAFEHIMGIKTNVQFCLDNNLSLISFCH